MFIAIWSWGREETCYCPLAALTNHAAGLWTWINACNAIEVIEILGTFRKQFISIGI